MQLAVWHNSLSVVSCLSVVRYIKYITYRCQIVRLKRIENQILWNSLGEYQLEKSEYMQTLYVDDTANEIEKVIRQVEQKQWYDPVMKMVVDPVNKSA